MNIKMLLPVSGRFHGRDDVKRGDVVEVDDVNGSRYIAQGYAEVASREAPPKEPEVERAIAPEYETAALDVPVEIPEAKPAPVALDEDGDDDESDESDDSAEAPKPQPRKGTAAPNARRR